MIVRGDVGFIREVNSGEVEPVLKELVEACAQNEKEIWKAAAKSGGIWARDSDEAEEGTEGEQPAVVINDLEESEDSEFEQGVEQFKQFLASAKNSEDTKEDYDSDEQSVLVDEDADMEDANTYDRGAQLDPWNQ